MKRTIYFFMIVAGWAAFSTSCSQTDSKDSQVETKIPVEVTTVRLGNLAQTFSYYGDIKAEFEVKVFSIVPDRFERFFVDAGDNVAKGAPIARIVATTIEQAVRQAEAALAAAKAQETN